MAPPAVPLDQVESRGDEVRAEEMALFRKAQIRTGQV